MVHLIIRCKTVWPVPKAEDGMTDEEAPLGGYAWQRALAILQHNMVEASAVSTLRDCDIEQMRDNQEKPIALGVSAVLNSLSLSLSLLLALRCAVFDMIFFFFFPRPID